MYDFLQLSIDSNVTVFCFVQDRNSVTHPVETCFWGSHMMLGQSLCLTIMNNIIFCFVGFLMLYDCKTFNGSSGSPVLKEVNGELQVVGIHRGILNETYYNISTLFSEVYKYVNSDDKKGLITICIY